MRSAGPLISKFRKSTLARKRDRISSTQSYDSLSGGTSISETPAGSGGRVYAGPRVRVRRGRTGKLPEGRRRELMLATSPLQCGARFMSCLTERLVKKYKRSYLLREHPGPQGRWNGRPNQRQERTWNDTQSVQLKCSYRHSVLIAVNIIHSLESVQWGSFRAINEAG